MCIDLSKNPLRVDAERVLGIRPQVSRFGGLYFLPRAPKDFSSALLIPEPRPNGTILHPTPEAVRAFEEWASPHVSPDDLGQSLQRLSHQTITPPELILFALGNKHLELNASVSAWQAYEKKLRHLAADCLREKHGGGALYACWLCIAENQSQTTKGAPP